MREEGKVIRGGAEIREGRRRGLDSTGVDIRGRSN